MTVEFADDDRDRLETDPRFTAGLDQAIVKPAQFDLGSQDVLLLRLPTAYKDRVIASRSEK